MFWRFCVISIVGALIGWNVVKCAPAEVAKNKEKVRAYEFGFNIEESHHRHEKRDENGIVMGEFGFITADGIYHVTVYATDENGKFKILAMKSYPYGNPEKKSMVATLPPVSRPVVVPQIRQQTALDTRSCGGCVLTTKLAPERDSVDPEAVFRPLSKTINDGPISRTPAIVGSLGSKGVSSQTPLQPKTNSFGVTAPKASSGSSQSSQKANSIGITASKATSGASANGKEYQLTNSNAIGPSAAQVPADRQSKAFGTVAPQGLGVRFGANDGPISPNLLSPTPSQVTQFTSQFGGEPSLSTSSNEPSQLPVENGNPLQQGLKPLQNTFRPNNATQNKLATVNSSPTPSFSSTPRIQNTLQSSIQGNTPRIQNTIKSSKQNTKTLQSPVTVITPNKPITPPTRIQTQNTNGANTPTAKLPSTSKLTPGAPPSSSQSIGKITPSSNGGGPLYRFKYVLDYNSHGEEGRIDGSKEGNYKTIDEDGVRRIIDYVANENGFQPHIKWERIPSNEVPTGENKLKEYEFVWFH